MASGEQELLLQIERLNTLGDLASRSVPAVAKALGSELEKQVARSQGPGGLPWRKTKTGGVPLQGAAAAVQITQVGTVIVMRLEGHHARHHLGAIKGKVQRKILPVRNIPQPMIKAIARVVTGEFFDIMGTTDSR